MVNVFATATSMYFQAADTLPVYNVDVALEPELDRTLYLASFFSAGLLWLLLSILYDDHDPYQLLLVQLSSDLGTIQIMFPPRST